MITSFKLTMDSPPSPTAPPPPSCTTAIPSAHGYVPPTACNANYGFHPSFEWNIVFAVAFGITTVAHVIQTFHYRKVSPPPLSSPLDHNH